MGYLLSIVVPTKDRYPYLKHLIELITSFRSDEIELVIQDNTADNTEILSFLENIESPHLKYYHTKEQLSVSDNSTKGILNSNGEYVCFIGDDDGVTRYVVDAVKLMKSKGYHILKSAPAVLKWPSFHSPKHYDVSGTVQFNEFKFTYCEKDCEESLETLLKTGIDTLGIMPKVYNGIVIRSTLDKIYERCGTFFPGPSPDMANAVALAIEEEKFVYVDFPVIIGGHSGHIGGDASRYKRGLGPLEEQHFIDQKYKDEWSERIPKLWASRTVWPESAITALKAYSATEYLEMIDYELILKKFATSHPDYIKVALSLSENKIQLLFYWLVRQIAHPIFRYFEYRKYRSENIFGGLKIQQRGIENIIQAEKSITEDLISFNLEESK